MRNILQALEPANVCLTADMLEAATGRTYAETMRGLREAVEARAVERSGEGNCYQLTEEGRAILAGKPVPVRTKEARPQYTDSLRQRTWNAIISKGKFSRDELIPLVRRDDELATSIRPYMDQFISLLERSGYLARLPMPPIKKGAGGGRARFRLARHTGPLVPVVKSGGVLQDRNTGEAFHVSSAP